MEDSELKPTEQKKYKITETPSPSESDEEDYDEGMTKINSVATKPLSVDDSEEKGKRGRKKREMSEKQKEVLKKARDIKIKKYEDYKEHDYKEWLKSRGYQFEDKVARKSSAPPPVIQLRNEKAPTQEEKKEKIMPKQIETAPVATPPAHTQQSEKKSAVIISRPIPKPVVSKPRNPFAE